MKHAVIKDGKVVNLVVADSDFALAQGWVECDDFVNLGWSYDGSVFTAPEIIDVVATTPAPTREELLTQLQTLTEQVQSLT
jgi:hypothetical protein